jgi:hypothetical protein
VRIRPVGFWANRAQTRALKQCRQVLGQPTEVPTPSPPSVAEWMLQVSGSDSERCPRCGHRPLQRVPIVPFPASQGRKMMPSILDAS